MTSKALNILLVEDSPVDALLLRAALEDTRTFRFALVHVERLVDALRELHASRFDVVLLDMGLPDSSGLEGLRRLREAAREIPILLLTGTDDEDTALAALQQGAQDYLVKGTVDARALTRSIRYAIERKRGEALQLAKDAAEQANLAKDHFLAVLSHELRTPLTPVLTLASMLEADDELPARFRSDIQTIRRNVELETRLIDDLLDVTRIVRGKLELHRHPVDLCQVMRLAVEVCQTDISTRRLEFGVDMGSLALYTVDADAGRLQQVFWNLLKNAIKFTPHGGCVHVRLRPSEGHVIVEITDSGMGIEPDAISRIFEAFEQGDRTVTRQFGGLGLGLAISKALVEMHGGTIEVRSPGKNRGATFTLRLPLASPGVSAENTPADTTSSAARLSLSILLVEDHGDTAKAMSRLLRHHGHEVECARDVESAMEMLGQKRFELLISDLGLPDGSGLDLMRQTRTKYPDLPGIALSGYGQEEDLRQSRLAGFAEHLVKPANLSDLLAAIAKAVGDRESGAEPQHGGQRRVTAGEKELLLDLMADAS